MVIGVIITSIKIIRTFQKKLTINSHRLRNIKMDRNYKRHYKVEIQGDYSIVTKKLEKYLGRKTEANTEIGPSSNLITLTNGSTMILSEGKDGLEILVSTTERYFDNAIKALSRNLDPEQLSYKVV